MILVINRSARVFVQMQGYPTLFDWRWKILNDVYNGQMLITVAITVISGWSVVTSAAAATGSVAVTTATRPVAKAATTTSASTAGTIFCGFYNKRFFAK